MFDAHCTTVREGRLLMPVNLSRTLCVVVALAIATGCTTARYRRNADQEVYGLIAEKTPNVPGMPASFTIEADPAEPLAGLPEAAADTDFLGEAAASEQGAHVIRLEKALELAVTHSRSYQNEKELLYLQALNLTLERHQFAPIFSGQLTGDYARSTSDVSKMSGARGLADALPGWIDETGDIADTRLSGATTLSQALGLLPPGSVPAGLPAALASVGGLAGSPGQLLSNYADLVESAFTATGANQPREEIMNERTYSGQTSFGVGILLKGGAEIALGLTSNFLRYVTGDPRVTTSSALTGSITQPLLRGAGHKIAAENLTQAERDLLYQLRSFTRFRKEFAVDVASNYYRILQSRDAARNTWQGYQAFVEAFERDQAHAEVGRITQADLGRSQQAKLNAEVSWIAAVRSYRQSMDEFKILLGLSTDAPVVLEPGELTRLRERGISSIPLSTEAAVDVALVSRLDLYTVRDEVDDAERKLAVAANALKPGLDLIVTGQVDTVPEDDAFSELDWQRARWSAGFDLDLPFDRKSERNAYRRALISHERAAREFDLAVDGVKLEVREAWRDLNEAEATYRIRQIAVDLNQRRVEEQKLRAELGRATALDQIDAQNDLVSAQNGLTAALVSHTIAKLRLWLDMGILYIKEDGQWEELSDVE
ncbi:MAG: TolC family protein [Candidatus Hydrogenedentes bacterium]|nr:TolC family protein [Candidatus Hydrogenedentota bacterium]